MVRKSVRRPPLWVLWSCAGFAATAACFMLPYSEASAVVIPLAAIVAIVYGTRVHRPATAKIWYLVAAGHSMSMLGQAAYGYNVLIKHLDAAPTVSYVFFLAANPLVAAGLILLVRARTSGTDRAGLIDAAIITTGLTLLAWTFLMRPVVVDGTLDIGSRLMLLVFPSIDVLVLALVVRLLAGPGARTPSFWLLTSALTSMLVADIALAYSDANGGDGGLWAAGWPIGFVLWGAAALHPSMRSLSEAAPVGSVTLSRSRMAVLTLTSMLAPGMLVAQGLVSPSRIDWAGIAAGAVVLFLLVLARMAGLVGDMRRQSLQMERMAHTDALTGIPNRRSWDLRLDEGLHPGQVLHIAVMDLDFFKVFNDRHGHQAGDQLLRECASAWTENLRCTDTLARYGGEEFGLVLAADSLEDAVTVMTRLRAVTPQGQTFSAGLVRWSEAESGIAAVKRADEALYRAKHEGRDRVCVAEFRQEQPIESLHV
jgi:diguanylate cyclase (GGDEF)-like protein